MREAESQSPSLLRSLKVSFNHILCANSEINASAPPKSLESYEFFLRALQIHAVCHCRNLRRGPIMNGAVSIGGVSDLNTDQGDLPMAFTDAQLSQNRPASVRDIALPRRERYHPSPADWRDETLYFLLPDRFSDGKEQTRPLLDRGNLTAARPALPDGRAWQWNRWAESGADRWQGWTLRGIRSKLGYLKGLGVTAIWIGPVFKQRGHLNSYHGYGIQDFLEVDPHFGDRRDLVELVADAHAAGLRIILDV